MYCVTNDVSNTASYSKESCYENEAPVVAPEREKVFQKRVGAAIIHCQRDPWLNPGAIEIIEMDNISKLSEGKSNVVRMICA